MRDSLDLGRVLCRIVAAPAGVSARGSRSTKTSTA